ncbi:MAG: hypothetical protein Q9227_002190 [Pyrenula ochraceoflavens]
MKVLIIGAGASGLLLAQGLTSEAGIDCTVYERHSPKSYVTRPREWGLTMHWGSEFLDRAISSRLRMKLQGINCDPFREGYDEAYPMLNGKTGEVLIALPGKNARRVSRRKLRHLLSQDINIEYGKTLSYISYDGDQVVAHFDDGTEAKGTCLAGCDGAKSVTRKQIVGLEKSQLTDSPITLINFDTTYTAETARFLRSGHPMMNISYHPEINNMFMLAVQDVENPDKPETWRFQLMLTWKGPPSKEELAEPEARIRLLKERGAQYAEPFRTAALSASDSLVIPVDKGQYWLPVPWDNHVGKVTLVGDAAHPMLPHRGQGLNNALKDASHLVDSIKSVQAGYQPLDQAITAYEEEMRTRGGEEVQITLNQAMLAHDWERFKESPIFKMGLEGKMRTNGTGQGSERS